MEADVRFLLNDLSHGLKKNDQSDEKGIILPMYNHAVMVELKFKLFPQQPNSPYLATCDFFLSPKNILPEKIFMHTKTPILRTFPKLTFRKTWTFVEMLKGYVREKINRN